MNEATTQPSFLSTGTQTPHCFPYNSLLSFLQIFIIVPWETHMPWGVFRVHRIALVLFSPFHGFWRLKEAHQTFRARVCSCSCHASASSYSFPLPPPSVFFSSSPFFLFLNIFRLFIYCVYERFACMCVCTLCVYLVPVGVRRSQILELRLEML